MAKINKIMAREVLDSRGNPTIEAKVLAENGISAKASVPSGASTGSHEALELRDNDRKRYAGKGVLKACRNINEILVPKLKGLEVDDLEGIDRTMLEVDGTKNKANLGANAILAVSLACARAAALANNLELFQLIKQKFGFQGEYSLPTPCFNIFNGGKHADTNLDFQEFMVIPLHKIREDQPDKNFPLSEQVRIGAEIFHELGAVLKEAGLDTDVGNEGGYAPDINSSIQAIEFILAAATQAGYVPGKDIGIGIDVGSSVLYNKEKKQYVFKLDQANFSVENLIGLYYEWFRKYPIVSIEDGLDQDDWEGWSELTRELGKEMLIVGDDLFVTNPDRLRTGLKARAANTLLVKPNQIGTLTETIDCIKLAQKHNYNIMVSHRSGETCDHFIADLSVAVGAELIKTGSLSRSERLAKYNRLMEIEMLLNGQY